MLGNLPQLPVLIIVVYLLLEVGYHVTSPVLGLTAAFQLQFLKVVITLLFIETVVFPCW